MVSIYNSVFDSLDKKSISQRLKLPLSLNLHFRKHWGPAGVLLKGSRVIGLLVMNIKPYSTMKISTLIPISLGLLMSIFPLAGGVKTGEKAPGFTLTDTYGVTHNLSDYEGNYVVLEWVNHECPFVKKHYASGNMPRLQKEWKEKGVVWLSINSTSPDHGDYKTPAESNKLTANYGASPKAVLMDPEGKVGKMYDAATTPHMYIINPEGELVYQGAIDSIPDARQMSIPRATNYVDTALTAVMDGGDVPVRESKAYGCNVKYNH